MRQITHPPVPSLFGGVRNFRDLAGIPVEGGLQIRSGRVYRSGHWGSASAEDMLELKRKGAHLIDLRDSWEVELEDRKVVTNAGSAEDPVENPGPDELLWKAVRTGQLEELRETLTKDRAAKSMARLYADEIAGTPKLYAGFLASVAYGKLPVVVHCSAGKDRTGWAVAVLLTALGAPESAILHDYMQSSLSHNQYLFRTVSGEIVEIDPEMRRLVNPLLEARPEYLNAAWASVEDKWGSRKSYLENGLGLSPGLLTTLRKRLVH